MDGSSLNLLQLLVEASVREIGCFFAARSWDSRRYKPLDRRSRSWPKSTSVQAEVQV